MAEKEDTGEQKEPEEEKEPKPPGRCKICGKEVQEESDLCADSFHFCSRKCLQKHLMRGDQSRHRRWGR